MSFSDTPFSFKTSSPSEVDVRMKRSRHAITCSPPRCDRPLQPTPRPQRPRATRNNAEPSCPRPGTGTCPVASYENGRDSEKPFREDLRFDMLLPNPIIDSWKDRHNRFTTRQHACHYATRPPHPCHPHSPTLQIGIHPPGCPSRPGKSSRWRHLRTRPAQRFFSWSTVSGQSTSKTRCCRKAGPQGKWC